MRHLFHNEGTQRVEFFRPEGLGVLPPLERAVVALVLLRCVAMPAARGQAPRRWSAAPPVKLARLHDNRALGNIAITVAVNRLHDQHALINGRAAGIRPSPAFRERPAYARLSERARELDELKAHF